MLKNEHAMQLKNQA